MYTNIASTEGPVKDYQVLVDNGTVLYDYFNGIYRIFFLCDQIRTKSIVSVNKQETVNCK